ncbi:MAG: hypothetical protein HYZ54_12550 [Ignavibacteriae bacterium]|nr:hypothetical protein [Ignavibacteriota bacterium]
MDIHNYNDIITSLKEMRETFYINSTDSKPILEEAINLWVDTRKLIAKVVEKGDEEINILQVLDTVIRRIISTYILIESGLTIEANIVLRNAIEFLMISIDISVSKDRLRIWIESENNSIEKDENVTWHFKPKEFFEKVKKDKEYPKWERDMILME